MRFLLLTAGSRGDVEPFLALARRITDEGHEVRLAVRRSSSPRSGPPASRQLSEPALPRLHLPARVSRALGHRQPPRCRGQGRPAHADRGRHRPSATPADRFLVTVPASP
ncbi:glycosyltransferase [Streptomyces actinomycinicus]|uniref:Glycosyltransferase n=1 Tax=Streptomyces actinomycinicus TaxID=1695166 RepID=A0A937ESD1_9ACTN|nr:glycosyltransferase [Streptomyces actinomycinicus]